MQLYHTKLTIAIVIVIVILFIMFFQNSLSAQDNTNEDVVVVSGGWRMSRAGEIEHYKNYTPEIIPEYFILGTLRFFDVKDTTNRIDLYDQDEEPLVNFLDAYIKDKFGYTLQKKENGFATYSSELAKRLRKYFDKDGKPDISLFNSTEEIGSFLMGVYYRQGDKINDSIYNICVVYSQPYNELVYNLLQRIDCDRIYYINRKYYTPGSSTYYFYPSVLLKKYLDTIEGERTKLYDYYVKNSKYYNKDRDTKYREEEKKMIEDCFSY